MNNAGMKKGIKLMNTNEKLREALEGLMPIVRIYLKKNPAPEIMTWDKNDVLPSGRIPDDKVVLIKPKQAYAKAEELRQVRLLARGKCGMVEVRGTAACRRSR